MTQKKRVLLKTELIQFKCSCREKKEIEEAATKKEMSISEYIRECHREKNK